MTIIPAKNYVLLKPLGAQKTKSGLYAPTSDEKKPEMGVLFKIGKGTPPVEMKIGDTVIFKRYMANEIPIPALGGEVVNPIAFEDIVAVIKEEDGGTSEK